jgi:hypothetical protein
VAATLLLAACGGGSGNDGLADGPPDDAKRLAFFTCLRKAGVEVNDQNGRVDIRVPRGISKVRMETIERACARKTGGGPGHGEASSPRQKAEFLDHALQFARCMRAHGVPMADPKAEGDRIRMEINGSQGNPNSPVFRRAQQACEAFNPKAAGKARAAELGKGSK